MTKKSERERRLREKTAMKTVDLFPSDLAEKIKLSAFDYQGDIEQQLAGCPMWLGILVVGVEWTNRHVRVRSRAQAAR